MSGLSPAASSDMTTGLSGLSGVYGSHRGVPSTVGLPVRANPVHRATS
ncbi:hypothetical protein [Amycolatopsis sp. CA-128772]|nr:hypothetical protein [Amycolatopsis sp. CA-128772]